jgi:hypothetical protein
LSSLDIFECSNRTGSGLIFIFNHVFMFKFHLKYALAVQILPKEVILELLPSEGHLERDVPTLALHGINGDSAGNYHLLGSNLGAAAEYTAFRPLNTSQNTIPFLPCEC